MKIDFIYFLKKRGDFLEKGLFTHNLLEKEISKKKTWIWPITSKYRYESIRILHPELPANFLELVRENDLPHLTNQVLFKKK
jgi:hypothetical protein